MTVTLELPNDLQTELNAEAARLGLPLDAYLLRLLTTGRSTGAGPKTGADLVAYWQNEGLIGTRTDVQDSLEHARQIRRQAEARERS